MLQLIKSCLAWVGLPETPSCLPSQLLQRLCNFVVMFDVNACSSWKTQGTHTIPSFTLGLGTLGRPVVWLGLPVSLQLILYPKYVTV